MSLTGIEAMYARPSFSPVWITITVVIVLRHLGVLALVAGRTTNARPGSGRRAFLLALFLSIIDTPNYEPAPSDPETAVDQGRHVISYRRNIDLYLTKMDFF